MILRLVLKLDWDHMAGSCFLCCSATVQIICSSFKLCTASRDVDWSHSSWNGTHILSFNIFCVFKFCLYLLGTKLTSFHASWGYSVLLSLAYLRFMKPNNVFDIAYSFQCLWQFNWCQLLTVIKTTVDRTGLWCNPVVCCSESCAEHSHLQRRMVAAVCARMQHPSLKYQWLVISWWSQSQNWNGHWPWKPQN